MDLKILVITNYYPPCDFGWGYMQLCEEVVDGLHRKGHEICVLTSHYIHGKEFERSYPVYRLLNIDPDWNIERNAMLQFFWGRKIREKSDIVSFEKLSREFNPDIVFVWPADGISRAMLADIEQKYKSVFYYFAGYLPEKPDEYINYWKVKSKNILSHLIKSMVKPLALTILKAEHKPIQLSFDKSIFVSHFLKNYLFGKGLIGQNSWVVYNGVDIKSFYSPEQQILNNKIVKCVIIGRISPEKGIHTVIKAMNLMPDNQDTTFLLDVIGDGPREYLHHCKYLIQEKQLENSVKIYPAVNREKIPAVLRDYDILVLSSEYGEPIARAMQEGMASGLLVVGTTTGGSGELLIDRITGIEFKPGDPEDLKNQLMWVIENKKQSQEIARSGQQRVRDEFSIEKTITEIEKIFLDYLSEHEI